MTYFFDLDYFNDNDVDSLFTVDATHCGNISRCVGLHRPWVPLLEDVLTGPPINVRRAPSPTARFFNHSCDPNLKVVIALTTSWDERIHRLAFFTKRCIKYARVPARSIGGKCVLTVRRA